jgi:hypothetical protein
LSPFDTPTSPTQIIFSERAFAVFSAMKFNGGSDDRCTHLFCPDTSKLMTME